MPSHSGHVTVVDTSDFYEEGAGAVKSVTTASAGGGGAHNNTQPTIVANFIIKT